jgi:Fe2+ or Zn2+ uptake regulation protein
MSCRPRRVIPHGNLRGAVLSTVKSPDARVAAILDQLAARGMRRTSARQAILKAFFAAEKPEPFLKALREDFDFDVDRRHFALVGICGACRDG